MVQKAIKHRIHEYLIRRGYHIHRISQFERLLLRRLRSDRPLVFVQVGANDGLSFDSLYWYVTKYHCKGLVVEPLHDMFQRLEYNYRSFPNVTPVRAAVHPSLREVVLHRVKPERLLEVPEWGTGIASVHARWHVELGIPSEEMIEERVPAIHLMELFERYEISTLDLLQIDVEGFDAEVIKMIDFARIRPGIIKYEARRAEFDEPVEELLVSHGYKLFHEGPDVIAWRE